MEAANEAILLLLANPIWPFLPGVDLLRLGADIGGGFNTDGGGLQYGGRFWRQILEADLKWRRVWSAWGQIVVHKIRRRV
jgi:hypothetical protein